MVPTGTPQIAGQRFAVIADRLTLQPFTTRGLGQREQDRGVLRIDREGGLQQVDRALRLAVFQRGLRLSDQHARTRIDLSLFGRADTRGHRDQQRKGGGGGCETHESLQRGLPSNGRRISHNRYG